VKQSPRQIKLKTISFRSENATKQRFFKETCYIDNGDPFFPKQK